MLIMHADCPSPPSCVFPNPHFWRGKRVLLTGHTGFKGSWLALWLSKLGATVTGIALPPPAQPNLFSLARIADEITNRFCDIRDARELTRTVLETRPEIVFHLAAQPLVRESYRDPLGTFSTNVMGTAHLLDSLRGRTELRVAVMVTTDKVYRNAEWIYPYREDDALGGHDPYSASKAASEIVIASYRDAFLAEQGTALASARAGNVIGGGDWSADRLIPDAVRAWQAGVPLEIRRPLAIRPWQHVLEALNGYLILAEKLWDQPDMAGAFNFGPHAHEAASVRHVIELARRLWGNGTISYADDQSGPHEAGQLALETAKSRSCLGVQPQWTLTSAVERTMNWYRAQRDGCDAQALCAKDFAAFTQRQQLPA